MGLQYIILIISQIFSLPFKTPAYFITPHLESKRLELESFSIDYHEYNSDNNQSFLLLHDSGELKPNYGIDYQKLYRLRFDPNKLARRNIKLSQSESNYEMNNYPINLEKANSSDIHIIDDIEIFNPNVYEPNSQNSNEMYNETVSIDSSIISTTTASNISTTNENLPEFSSQLPSIHQQPEFEINIEQNGTEIEIDLTDKNDTNGFSDIEDFVMNTNILNDTQDNLTVNHISPIFTNFVNDSSTYNFKPSFSNIINKAINRIKNLFSLEQIENVSNGTTYSSPTSKLLNLFTIIKFENSECTTNFIRNFSGICYNEKECRTYGGNAMGQCAAGYGVCCVFKSSCDGIVNQKVSYFESPNYPLPFHEKLACIFTIKLRKNVKQLKLEYITFELKRPNNGNCEDDQFIISGHSKNFKLPILCGINTGQHMYIDVTDAPDRIIFLSVFTNNYGNRAFSFRITQLESNFAPEGCLQYYTGQSGYIKSFNYDEASGLILSRTGSYMNNLNYAICIKREQKTCTIAYTNEPNGSELPFQLVNYDEEDNLILPEDQAGADIFNCPDDYITIASLRMCGSKLNDGRIIEDFNQNSVIIDYQNGPIVVFVHTNDKFVGKGFKLFFIQEYCA